MRVCDRSNRVQTVDTSQVVHAIPKHSGMKSVVTLKRYLVYAVARMTPNLDNGSRGIPCWQVTGALLGGGELALLDDGATELHAPRAGGVDVRFVGGVLVGQVIERHLETDL